MFPPTNNTISPGTSKVVDIAFVPPSRRTTTSLLTELDISSRDFLAWYSSLKPRIPLMSRIPKQRGVYSRLI